MVYNPFVSLCTEWKLFEPDAGGRRTGRGNRKECTVASKNKNKKKNEAVKTGPTGFATDRRKISKFSRVMALLLGIIMIVFMLLSSSVYLFN